MLLERDFQPGTITAATFFGDVCPRLLRVNRDRLPGGRFGFVVRGHKGGRWTLDLDNAHVIPRASPSELDVCVELEHDAFQALLNGELDVRRAWEDGKLLVTGERHRLAVLPRVLL